MASIIIPAHNEETVLDSTLISLLHQSSETDEIFVIANACSDKTAQVAIRFSPRVRVVESQIPSKTNALNIGDSLATQYPRVYLDADIVLTPNTLASIKNALQNGDVLAASPSVKMDFSLSNWFVKAYYDIWLNMPFSLAGMMGSGVYALSEKGRARFDTFPDLISDDGFVRSQFKEHERKRVLDGFSIVQAPATMSDLMKIKIRSRMGQIQLRALYPKLIANEEKSLLTALVNFFKQPENFMKYLIYVYVTLATRLIATYRLKTQMHFTWEKDLSSRVGKDSSKHW